MDAIVQQKEKALTVKPTTPRAIVMAEALREDTEQRALLQEYVKHHMVLGTDYGVIPGTAKPTLLKPGAEKLTDLFRCTPSFDLLEKIEDWDKNLFHYVFRVRIASRDAGTVLAEGYGSANSREGRYRWRDARRLCPKCGKDSIIKGKQEYGGGWICFVKKGGCGAKWSDGATEIESQQLGKVENDDIATLANTILKMAKKRALVDGAIALARCSDIFTQDVEDLEPEEVVTPRAPAKKPEPDATQRAAAAVVEQVQEQAELQADAMALMNPKARQRRDALWLRLVGSGKGQLGMTATKAAFWMTKGLKSLTSIKSVDDLTDEQLTKLEEAFSHEFGD